ncbi:MAG TPA: ATP-dependent 6-phosphofructokinase [Kofleriaceae bacterium]|nr:ATP-dependent 6-phosphofructokinase [Kofleriaceae bacterium]
MGEGRGRIGILTSGGDAPGMNAAVRAATLVALGGGFEVAGIRRGYRGLLERDIVALEAPQVLNILREGGTMLGSARCLAFHQREVRDQARAILADEGIDALLVIGGNGSLTGALALSDPAESEHPPRVAGIPASIDNDLALTSLAIGVDTAMNTIVEAVDKIADTASAHDRTFIVEVMGRNCGYLAMTAAIAGGADGVLYPEAWTKHHSQPEAIVDQIVKTVLTVRGRPGRSRRVIFVKAEGVPIGVDQLKREVDARLAAECGDEQGETETRVTVLGHVVRGGRPSAFDRLLGSRLANVAVRALMAGENRVMASWMPPVPIPEPTGRRAVADPYCWLVDLEAVLHETARLMAGEGPLAEWRAEVFDDLEQIFLL